MRFAVADYPTYVFDCDGVILDSNSLKSEAFRALASPFGAAAADALLEYHHRHGGVSRQQKLAWFLDSVLGLRGTERELLAAMKKDFTSVKHAKPKASRADSAEMYVVAMGFRG